MIPRQDHHPILSQPEFLSKLYVIIITFGFIKCNFYSINNKHEKITIILHPQIRESPKFNGLSAILNPSSGASAGQDQSGFRNRKSYFL